MSTCAKSGLMHRSKRPSLFDRLVGSGKLRFRHRGQTTWQF